MILIVVDKKGSAIDILSEQVVKHNPHLNIQIQSFHPKRPSVEEVDEMLNLWDKADLVQIAYWKSGEKFKEMYPDKWNTKKKILCHYNPYDITQRSWDDYDKVIVGNETIHAEIPYAKLIPYCINLDFFTFNEDYTKEKVVHMAVARIESKKGVREVAQACKELGYKFILVGRISDKNYFDQIMQVNPDTDFRQDITPEQLKESYYESAIHVCNSVDNFESGTLPILEAMACGVPVLSRNVGHVPDIYDDNNMVVRKGGVEDIEDLKTELKNLIENPILRDKLRINGWNTVKNRPAQKYARQFNEVYYDTLKVDQPFVSIIIPTFDRPEVLAESLICAINQTYPYKEIIVSDSGNMNVEPLIAKFREQTNVPIRYIRFPNHGEYTLAKARNLAIVESQGDFLCFCDERIGMEPESVAEFVKYHEYKVWSYGVKDEADKNFVENFSFVNRESLIIHGMFNERINVYGGMSQEIRIRFTKHGFLFVKINTAKAKSLAKSKSKFGRKEEVIKAKELLFQLYR